MKTLNINVGVLGHVDSGKTSLAKALSTLASTSAFDKNPQSKTRGITLDLGFSSFEVDVSQRIQDTNLPSEYDKIQFTLVDCPGHGSLIRTILCGKFHLSTHMLYQRQGAQIIDIMLLVMDVTKGFQTQTAECLVIGAITGTQMLVVLNKCDLLKEATREVQIEKMDLNNSAARSGDPDIEHLINLLLCSVSDPSDRRLAVQQDKFLFAVDHCFLVTGQGTVMTGTVLAGTIRVGEGDRAGICVAQLDPGLLERGLVGTPGGGLLQCYACVLLDVCRVTYYKGVICSKAKFHVFVGHETALARLTFFRMSGCDQVAQLSLDGSASYEYLEELPSEKTEPAPGNRLPSPFSVLDDAAVLVLLEFDQPFVCPPNGLVIGARLDSTSPTACRLAFHGRIGLQLSDPAYRQNSLPKLSVYRVKQRYGQIERVMDSRTCIVRGLFKRETNWDIFLGLRASLVWKQKHSKDATPESSMVVASADSIEAAEVRFDGRLESSFGQSGKCRLTLNEDLPETLVKMFAQKSKKGAPTGVNADAADDQRGILNVILEFKRHAFDPKQRIIQ